MPSGNAVQILTDATTAAPTYGAPFAFNPPAPYQYHDVYASISGTGAVTATVVIQKSPKVGNAVWADAFTITLSGTTTDAYTGLVVAGNGAMYRAKVTAISGTGATVNVWLTE